jgi:hypothetical protein
MKFNLKPPGTERLRLKCDDPLSNFAFSFSLRRYTPADRAAARDRAVTMTSLVGGSLRIMTQLTLNRHHKSARLDEHLPGR